ncbi:MAG: pyridoxal-phosphate dependent enzyme, partial [Treponema sp.]|nr:pyridoxal-phosphate dependent enzyme [Treponema sp.]
ISALAVEGSFDDCQRLVKAAFNEAELQKRLALSSANSINVSRLIPQAVYYAAAAGKVFAGRIDDDGAATPRLASRTAEAGPEKTAAGQPVSFCVPSGNFGNLTAGLYAMKMEAPILGFIAATNINKTIPDYLATGLYEARPSQRTISNAMDVGAPSNFERMTAHWSYETLRQDIRGAFVSDQDTRKAITRVREKYGYFLDPHGAVGWQAADDLTSQFPPVSGPLAVLATAHPAKFAETVEPLTGPIPFPDSLKLAMRRTPESLTIPADLSALIEVLETP